MSGRFIYFIRPKGLQGPVKIGCSTSPESEAGRELGPKEVQDLTERAVVLKAVAA